jgi:hypothetical protein
VTLWALGSLHGSPGATTTAVALASCWPAVAGRTRLLIEADPDGGVLAGRFEHQLRLDRSLTDLVVAIRQGWDTDACLACARELSPGLPVVVAPPSSETTRSALMSRAEPLAVGLASADLDAIVDLGRIGAASPALPLARRAVVTALVSRCRLEDALALQTRVADLAAQRVGVALILVAEPDRAVRVTPEEIAHTTGVPLLGVLPHDPRSAGTFAGSGGSARSVQRSLWWRSLREIASVLMAQAPAIQTGGGDIPGPSNAQAPARQTGQAPPPASTRLDPQPAAVRPMPAPAPSGASPVSQGGPRPEPVRPIAVQGRERFSDGSHNGTATPRYPDSGVPGSSR